MVTQTIQFETVSPSEIGSGTVTAFLFSGVTLTATLASITENGTLKGRHTGTVEDIAAATYRLVVKFNGYTINEPDEFVTLLLAVGTYIASNAIATRASQASLDDVAAVIANMAEVTSGAGTTLVFLISGSHPSGAFVGCVIRFLDGANHEVTYRIVSTTVVVLFGTTSTVTATLDRSLVAAVSGSELIYVYPETLVASQLSVNDLQTDVDANTGYLTALTTDMTTLLGRVTASVYTMWTDLIAMITDSGTVDAKFDVAALSNAPSGGGGGGGAFGPGTDLVTIKIEDDGVAEPDVSVWVTSDSGGLTIIAGTLTTNGAGEVTFRLTAGVSYYLWANKTGKVSITGRLFVAEADT